MYTWNNSTRKIFRLTLQQVYPSYEELDLFVSEAIDENLAAIAGDKRLAIAIGSLLRWAQKDPGKLDELFKFFCEDHPNHPNIPLIVNSATALGNQSVGETCRPNFITDFRDQLIHQKQIHDLSRNEEFSGFYFIGYRAMPSAIDFIALVEADGLSERQIVDFRDQFFTAVQAVSYSFGLRPLARNPNGLLAFIFEQGCSSEIASFIQKQSRADSFGKSAVIVSWAVDAPGNKVYTHKNPVAIMPPVWILDQAVFPGIDFLIRALEKYAEPEEEPGK